MNKIELIDLGYNDFFEGNRKAASDGNFIPARVIAEHKGMYVVRNETSELSAKITGKMMFTATSREDYPAVGDWVLIDALNDEQASVKEILPRKTVLARKSAGNSEAQIIASNIDTAFIVQAPDRDYSLNRFERYLALAESGGIKPVLILNKIDLVSGQELRIKLTEIGSRFANVKILAISTLSGDGTGELKNFINPGMTYCFLGSSGVGKSSIINMLAGINFIKTGEVSPSTERGRHVTVHRELFVLENGGLLVDTPGMREIGLIDSAAGIKNVFGGIEELSRKCKFKDCGHINEPGCAVLEAVNSGMLDKDKYGNYLKLSKENEYNSMTKQERREKDRKFGKFMKTAKKELKGGSIYLKDPPFRQ